MHPPRFANAWITTEDVNSVIAKNGFAGGVDLLSLDLDGIDYWIWRSIEVIQPRIVVAEYQNLWGWERSVTVPYAANFCKSPDHPDYCGASLRALVKLGAEKGYRLVGVNRFCFNAFFVQNGVADEILPAVAVQHCFDHPHAAEWMSGHRPLVEHLHWEEV